MDLIANNLANLNTTGFKSEKLSFAEYLMPVASDNSFEDTDTDISFVADYKSVTNLQSGPVEQTGGDLDVALGDDGWFVVEGAEGDLYTRNGAFTLRPDGTLVTVDNRPVKGDGGQIIIDMNGGPVTIARDGTISNDAGQIGKFQVVRFEDATSLTRQGDSLFKGTDPLPAPEARMQQGALERSNVRAVTQITEMISVTRAYQTITNLMKKQDELRVDAIEQLAQVPA
jgi:flagellar basal-body rod protein FlgF